MRLGIYVILEENVSEHNMGTIRKTSVYKAVTDSEMARIELRARVEEKCAELGFEDVDLPSNMEEFDLYHAFKDEVEDDCGQNIPKLNKFGTEVAYMTLKPINKKRYGNKRIY